MSSSKDTHHSIQATWGQTAVDGCVTAHACIWYVKLTTGRSYTRKTSFPAILLLWSHLHDSSCSQSSSAQLSADWSPWAAQCYPLSSLIISWEHHQACWPKPTNSTSSLLCVLGIFKIITTLFWLNIHFQIKSATCNLFKNFFPPLPSKTNRKKCLEKHT